MTQYPMQLPIEQIIEAMVDVVLVVDQAGLMPMSNAAAQHASGYSRDELAAMPVAQLLTDEHSGLRTPVRRRVESGESLRRTNAWLTTKTGLRIPVSVTAAPITETDVARGIVLVVRDNGEVRQLLAERDAEIARREVAERTLRRALSSIEQRLEETRAHLLVAERRASLGTLAAGLSSDLRTVGRRQRESLEVFTDVVLPDHAAAALAELYQIAEHLDTNAERLTRLALPPATHARPTSLHRTIHEVVAMLRGAGTLRDHELTFAFADPPVFVKVLRVQLEQIFVNLLVNAADAMRGAQGTILIAVHASAKPDRVLVEVSDTGVGIAPEHVGRVFEPFFTTKGGEAAIGLGLSVVREVVQSVGGEIKVAGGPGIGATFQFDLPCAADPDR